MPRNGYVARQRLLFQAQALEAALELRDLTGVGFTLSLQQILRLLHVNLFARRDLVALLSGSALVTPSVSQQNQLVLL